MEKNSIKTNWANHMVRQLLYYIHRGEGKKLFRLCTPSALWKYGCFSGVYEDYEALLKHIETYPQHNIELIVQELHTKKLVWNSIIATGTYTVSQKNNKTLLFHGAFTIVTENKKAAYIQLELRKEKEKIHKVKAINESVHYISEKELLYLESLNEHILWHYSNHVIESLDTLTHLEQVLSSDFIRVHRSYVINRNYCQKISRDRGHRCMVVMKNQDEIPIPYRKYVKIRELLSKDMK